MVVHVYKLCQLVFHRTQHSERHTSEKKKEERKKRHRKKERLEEEEEEGLGGEEDGWEKVKGGVPLVKVKGGKSERHQSPVLAC